jgi:hypothetical protein
MDVDVARLPRVAHELDPAGAIDEVEEDELSHLAPRHCAAGEPARVLRLRPGLERFCLGANRGDLVTVGESLRRRHGGRV